MYSKQNCPQKLRKLKKARLDSRVAAILVVRKGRKMLIVGTMKKMQAKDQREGKTKQGWRSWS